MKPLITTYFGPISWYKQLACATEPVYIEACENFIKQTERSRCKIMTANGVQTLSVPITLPKAEIVPGVGGSPSVFCDASQKKQGSIRSVRISDHDNWRKLHWQALCSAYGNSPFFEFYADDIKPFFEPNWEFLFDYNLSIINKVCELLDIHPEIRLTEQYQHIDTVKPNSQSAFCNALQDNSASYYQVFQLRFGFVPNLSILDLLFNMGPESILYLMHRQ